MADHRTGTVDNMTAHAGHTFEEWHAYLSCDPQLPQDIPGDASGICCHTCGHIVWESSDMYV